MYLYINIKIYYVDKFDNNITSKISYTLRYLHTSKIVSYAS